MIGDEDLGHLERTLSQHGIRLRGVRRRKLWKGRTPERPPPMAVIPNDELVTEVDERLLRDLGAL